MRSRFNVLRCGAIVIVLAGMSLMTPVAGANFGLVPGSVTESALNGDGTIDTQAGSHSYSYNVSFALNTDIEGHTVGGELRDIVADLSQGLVADPRAVPVCPRQDFEGATPHCSPSTQVGVVHVNIPGFGQVVGPVYNVNPPPGVAVQLGFSAFGLNALENATVSPDNGYAAVVSIPGVPIEVAAITETIWGIPADPSHDAQRGRAAAAGYGPPVSTDAPLLPFLTLPATCTAPLETRIEIDSTLDPGHFVGETAQSLDSGGNPTSLQGCGSVPFKPSIAAAATGAAADSASGLDFALTLPNEGLLNPSGIVETEPKRTEVTLPAGVTVNPSAASGMGVCTPAQYAAVSLTSSSGQGCPEDSKLGTVVARTPLLEEAVEGSVYLASPHDNPFDSLVALYIVTRAPERGVLVKQAGEVHLDPATGQLKATFDGLPPLPYSSFDLHFKEGPRAPLTTPLACGTYVTTSDLTPWSAPEGADASPSAQFQITSGANGSACVSGEAQEPNQPGFEAGTSTPIGGSYAPFVMKLTRENGTQRLSAVNLTLPQGLVGKPAGVAECSDAQIAAAAARTGDGGGALEQANPSCPGSSEVGTVTVGAGSGSPLLVGGHAYLAGPYRGAPLSLAIITPAVAGPFDLGVVVVRAALYIDPNTAQVTVKSDPLPRILQGIPLDIRSIRVSVDRVGFTLNPTSCNPMSITGQAISTQNQTASLSDRFQVGACQNLPFKPALTASTQGKTSKANGAGLTVKVAQRSGDANIHKVALTLPLALPARLTTLQKACTEAQFALNPAGCPPESFIGTAKAITPILDSPLTGPAILVSHGGAAFPDVVFLLQANERGGTIRIDLDGKTDIKKGITHSRFETVPDAPITSFETSLPQGPHSVLAATGNLCTSKLAMPTEMIGQNGAQYSQTTEIAVTGCPKTKVLTRAQKLALALKACHKKPKGSKRHACERAARKQYGSVKKKAKKK